jgi:putative phosphoesterase
MSATPSSSSPTRLGLLSDSHGRHERTARAVSQLVEAGAELLVHLGDINSCEVLDALLHRLDDKGQPDPPVHVVFGNTDWQVDEFAAYARPLGIIVDHPVGRLEIDGKVIVFQHGDRYQEMEQALAEGVDYLCHGHTHEARNERVGRTHVINPGALQRAQRYSVAILDLSRDEVEFLEVEA